MMIVKVRDLIAAEEALEAAEREARELRSNVDGWSAFESTDRQGKRHLHVSEAQFARQAFADGKVREAHASLMALRQQFAQCTCPHSSGVA